eukprot:5367756-Pleurochrysis_carterae.AAC.1
MLGGVSKLQQDAIKNSQEQQRFEAQERDKSRQAQLALASELEEIEAKRRELLRKSARALETLAASHALTAKFEKAHAKKLPDPMVVTAKQILKLRADIERLEEEVQRLVSRSESDGLLLAMRSYARANALKPKDLAMQVSRGKTRVRSLRIEAQGERGCLSQAVVGP